MASQSGLSMSRSDCNGRAISATNCISMGRLSISRCPDRFWKRRWLGAAGGMATDRPLIRCSAHSLEPVVFEASLFKILVIRAQSDLRPTDARGYH